MDSQPKPWTPDPRLADPLIALLGTFEVLMAALSVLKLRSQGGAGQPSAFQAALSHLPQGARTIGGAVAMLLFLGGIATGLMLLAGRHAPRPEAPRWAMSGRAAALVLLGWHAGHLILGALVVTLMGRTPQGRVLALPLAYGLSAALGTWMLLRAEGIDWRELAARVAPGQARREAQASLAWALALLSLGFLMMAALAWILAPLLRHLPGPQAELTELLRSARGFLPTTLLLLTVAGLAPLFEELLMRGFLLPLLRQRWGWTRALLVSSLVFGLLHLQPAALPGLSALGLALGLGVWRTGSVRSSVAAHALWNGSLFLLLRTMAA